MTPRPSHTARLPLVALLASLGTAALSSCDGNDRAGRAPTPQGGAEGAASQDGAAGGAAGAAAAGLWSCGTAAGVCTCVQLDIDPAPASGDCAESDCCFVSVDNSCSCRLDQAGLDCTALREALGFVTRTDSCPP